MCTGAEPALCAASAAEAASAAGGFGELAGMGIGMASAGTAAAGLGELGSLGSLAGMGDIGGFPALGDMGIGMDLASSGLGSLFDGGSMLGMDSGMDLGLSSFDPAGVGALGGQTIVPGDGGLMSKGLTSLGPNTVSQGNLGGFLNGGGNASATITGGGAGYMPMTSTPIGTGGGLQDIMNGARGALGKMSPVQLAGGLYSMYSKNAQANALQDQYNQMNARINGMYAPGSPEYNLMKQEMERKDAAAGRNSQYGTRATELAGKLAGLKTNALIQAQSGQNTLLTNAAKNRYSSLSGLFADYSKANFPGLSGMSNAQNGMILS